MNVYIPYTRLPNEYQEVEYIQTSGTQFIDTGITPHSNIQIETKVSVVTTSQNLPVFGNYVDNSALYTSGDFYHLTCYSSKWYWGLNGSESNGGTYSPTVGTQYEIIYNNSDNQVLVNGSSLGSSSGTVGYTGTTLAISVRGNNHANNKFYGQYKYYYFNVFNKITGEYERQMIPCYRKSDGVIGLYDLVNSVFYTNQGTGTFNKGNDVNMTELKNAYIGEYIPWTPDASRTLLYLPLESNTTDYSGRSISTTASGVSYTTAGGVTSAHIGSTGGISVAAGAVTKDLANMTIAVLFYLPAAAYSSRRILMEFNNNSYCNFSILNEPNGSTIQTGYISSMNTSFSGGVWTSLIITGNADGYCLYKDGTLVTTGTGSSTPWWRGTGSSQTGQYIFCGRGGTSDDPFVNGNLREVIFEKTKRSVEDVSNYYQRIKAKLGF